MPVSLYGMSVCELGNEFFDFDWMSMCVCVCVCVGGGGGKGGGGVWAGGGEGEFLWFDYSGLLSADV